MQAMQTVPDLAAEADRAFEIATRDGGEDYVRTRDDAPGWLQGLIFAAHGNGDMLPDDWRYGVIHDALEAIADAGEDADLDDLASEFADQVDVYSGELAEWLGSHSYRQAYCDEACSDGLVSPDATMDRRIMAGQYLERREVFEAVREHLEGLAE